MGLRRINYFPKMARSLARARAFDARKLVVVDVGARLGGEKHWDNFGDQVMLVGFEPDEAECRSLNEKLEGSNHRYFPVALSDAKGSRTFYLTKFDASCGFYQRDMKFWSRLSCKDNVMVKGTRTIDAVDFDSFARKEGISYVDFMKVDAEGAELDILKGSSGYLKDSVLGIATEVVFAETGGQPAFADLDSFMRSLGFRLFDIEVSRFSREMLTSPEELNEAGATSLRGQVIGADAVYFRDAVAEIGSDRQSRWDDNAILKLASLFEIYGLPDCAIELLQTAGKNGLLKGSDLGCLIDLLTPEFMGSTVGYDGYLKRLERIKTLRAKGYKSGISLGCTLRQDFKAVKNILWQDMKACADRFLPSGAKGFIRKLRSR